MKNLDVKTGYVGSVEISQVRKGNQLVLAPNGDKLWYDSNELPSLDLRFADNKSMTDAVTGQSLITFNRNSRGGTYVDSDGLIKTATTNLLVRSEEFSTTWTKGTNTTITPNYGAAPNGTMTADRVEMIAGPGTFLTQSVSVIAGFTYTLSVYARATSGTAKIALQQGGVNIQIWTISATWQRLSVQFTATATGSTTFGFDNDDSVTDFLLWGAQLEQSSTVGEYIPTTSTINSAPRFDHDPTTGESLGLLVEESRTNLLLQSEDFSTTWLEVNASIAVNQTTAPDGNATADKLVCGTGTPLFQGIDQSFSATTSAARFSVYVKAAEIDQVELRSFNPTDWAIFELSTQQVLSQSGSPAPTITDAGNGWYRCSITSSSSGVTSFRISLASGGSRTFTPISGAGLYLWGAQLEEGSFPTSYIPTTTAAVTRNADVASISGSNFSSWYRQDEGTVFAEVTPLQTSAGNQFIWRTSANDYGNTVFLNQTGSGNYSFGTSSGGVFDGITASSAYTINQKAQLAAGYMNNNLALSFNGSNVSTDSSATLPLNMNRLDIGSDHLGVNRNKLTTIRRLTYWPTRLANSTLQTITQ